MLITFILSLAFLVNGDDFSSEWKEWKELHGKEYQFRELESLRYRIFVENSRKIQEHNEEYQRGLHTFTMGMNQFGDLLYSEFLDKYSGLKGQILEENTAEFGSNPPVPKSVDWTKEGAVTDVKDQGHCASCWAFASVGAIESQVYIHKKKLVPLSEKQLLDCSGTYGNMGCDGGLMEAAYRYVIDAKGIASGEEYPYNAVVENCIYNETMSEASLSSYQTIKRGDENHLKTAVATVGPVSVAIDSSSDKFHFYKSGVYTNANCSSYQLDHAVLAVGYGTDEETGMDYWLVKNSWSLIWGMDGYMKMARNKNNMCGIATLASYPIL